MKRYITLFVIIYFSAFFVGCNEKNKPHTSDISNEKIIVQKKEPIQEPIKKTEPTNEVTKLVEKKTIKIESSKLKSYPTQTIQRQSTVVNKKNIKNFDFNIIKKGFEDDNTLLIVGGIQGDEPGGFMAASLIATHYEIKKGSVWIVPNLNFYSIIKRSRGPYGDMNRKFASLSKNDPEYESIQRIKNYINDKSVKLVVNLHDGSGFYRPKYEDNLHSPYRWGQCSIIDQSNLDIEKYGNLEDISNQVVAHVNKSLLKDEHVYNLHNTRTAQGDKEMEKTLTYYAINKGKAAFGNEASKSLPTHQRAYYHLLALEKYMDIMGIEYERKFNLNDQVVKNILDNDIEISLYDNKIKLPLSKIRNFINYFPVKSDGTIDFVPSNPLMSIVKKHNEYIIYYGNRRLAKLKADYTPLSKEKASAKIKVDSKDKEIKFGSVIDVKKGFMVYPKKNYRVNIIGYTNKSKKETNIVINQKKMQKRFSIDKTGSTYRVEFYTKDKFAGMILVKFAS